ncbi:MAG: hypothetical protein HRT89_14280 [Lentisphaeria bacterium]|nr:hypothetical protein [Lentisphaeria bacterium]
MAKPIDVWLISIEALEKAPDTTEKEVEMGQKAGNRGGARGGMGLGWGKQAKSVESKAAEVQWFILTGHCVGIPKRKIFTQAQISKFKSLQFTMKAKPGKKSDKKTEDLDPTVFMKTNEMTRDIQLPTIFESSLRFLPMVSSDENETRLTKYRFKPRRGEVDNISDFEIQLKLVKPIKLKR